MCNDIILTPKLHKQIKTAPPNVMDNESFIGPADDDCAIMRISKMFTLIREYIRSGSRNKALLVV